ncbi:TPA: transposase [Candidatus Woesearchaeota archaeon]|nr:transposase [Candidatus Woesearchaeota archaeon]
MKYYDQETHRSLVFLTNNFLLPSPTIAQLYKCRWQIELSFKWIKQHLRIKTFYGTSENAVRTQRWISVCVLAAILKKRFKLEHRLCTIIQILSVSLFEKISIDQALANIAQQNWMSYPTNQHHLIDLSLDTTDAIHR